LSFEKEGIFTHIHAHTVVDGVGGRGRKKGKSVLFYFLSYKRFSAAVDV
jgi:hypothetical protein